MNFPVLSVVIPTGGGRPDFLRRAVLSAMKGFDESVAEVIIVPNGPQPQWRDAIAAIEDIPKVRILPIIKRGVCAARNHGLANANGHFVRFLDDDDYLLPEIAAHQVSELLSSGSDVSSYGAVVIDDKGIEHGKIFQPSDSDFISAQLGPSRLQLPFCHLYKRSLIKNFRWNESISLSEDIEWLHSIASQSEVRWISSREVVGVWFQHSAPRLSLPHASNIANKIVAKSILQVTTQLSEQGRLTDGRRRAAAAGLWLHIHRGFYFQPYYWSRIARLALALDQRSHPDIGLFHSSLGGFFSPLAIEWLMLPKRLLNHAVRKIRGSVLGWDYVRNI